MPESRSTGPTVLVVGCTSGSPHGQDQFRRLSAQARRRGIRLLGADSAEHLADPGLSTLPGADTVALDCADPAARAAFVESRPRVDAVITLKEGSVLHAALLATELGLAGNPVETVRTIRTKDLCRQALRAAGFAQPRCAAVSGEAEARAVLAEWAGPGPWIVKPRDGMGSEGVALVSVPGQLAAAVAPFAAQETFLVEEFVEGAEFSAEGVLVGGEPRILTLTAKRTGAGSGFVETGHHAPAELDDAVAEAARSTVAQALKAVGVVRGIVHVEFWIRRDGRIILGELHARPGGDFIHALVEETRPGFELFGTLLDDLLDLPMATAAPETCVAGVEFLVYPPGRVTSVRGWQTVAADPALLAAALLIREGDRIAPVVDSGGRHGVLVAAAPTATAVESALRDARASLDVRIGPDR